MLKTQGTRFYHDMSYYFIVWAMSIEHGFINNMQRCRSKSKEDEEMKKT